MKYTLILFCVCLVVVIVAINGAKKGGNRWKGIGNKIQNQRNANKKPVVDSTETEYDDHEGHGNALNIKPGDIQIKCTSVCTADFNDDEFDDRWDGDDEGSGRPDYEDSGFWEEGVNDYTDESDTNRDEYSEDGESWLPDSAEDDDNGSKDHQKQP